MILIRGHLSQSGVEYSWNAGLDNLHALRCCSSEPLDRPMTYVLSHTQLPRYFFIIFICFALLSHNLYSKFSYTVRT